MFEDSITAMSEQIERMPVEDVHRLGRLLQELDPRLTQVISDTLERAYVEERLAFGKYRFFEHFLETWWTHTLETKLAAIIRVAALAAPGTWPDGFRETSAFRAYSTGSGEPALHTGRHPA